MDAPDTYTPILWATMTDDERYEEYCRLRATAWDLLQACQLAIEEGGALMGATRRGRIRAAIDQAVRSGPARMVGLPHTANARSDL